MKKPDLICLGEPLFEFSDVGNGTWVSGIGGDVSNVAIAAARQGARVAMLTQLGNDPFGAMIRETWRSEGIDDTRVVTQEEAATGIYFITHKTGEHQFEYRRAGSAAARMRPEDLNSAALKGAQVLHLSGISQAISASASATASAAIDQMLQYGGRVSYDTNLRLKLWPLERARKVIHDTVARADIVLPGYDDARQLTGMDRPEDILSYYRSLGPAVVAMTMGDNGVLVSFQDEVQHLPSPKVEVVDASGAGDCFDGAFLSKLIEGKTVPEAAVYAAAAAALSVTGYGATKPIPTHETVMKQFPELRGAA